MSEVKRFYTISNSAEQPKRGWIMHKRETKWFFPLRGVTKIEVEKSGRGRSPSGPHGTGNVDDIERETYVLDAAQPAILQIPPEHWFLIEQDGTAEVQIFSNCRVGEFPNDDFRKG